MQVPSVLQLMQFYGHFTHAPVVTFKEYPVKQETQTVLADANFVILSFKLGAFHFLIEYFDKYCAKCFH